jgi:hypothetical protein
LTGHKVISYIFVNLNLDFSALIPQPFLPDREKGSKRSLKSRSGGRRGMKAFGIPEKRESSKIAHPVNRGLKSPE